MTDLTVDGGEFSLFSQHNGVDFFEGSKQKVLSNIKCKCKDFNAVVSTKQCEVSWKGGGGLSRNLYGTY